MLVLTRKLNEQIMIGDDIKVTLIRVRGNTIRIGIEAPRDVRIVRGELERMDADESLAGELSEREQAFAHPPTQPAKHTKNSSRELANRLPNTVAATKTLKPTEPKLFTGTVTRSGEDATLSRSPLAAFVAAG